MDTSVLWFDDLSVNTGGGEAEILDSDWNRALGSHGNPVDSWFVQRSVNTGLWIY
ncbi:hypothetical protein CVCC1112_3066 [Paenarthrobacter nicotinovorans]|nr:hypothetical protein CVCC1112_3066 [Paenarthrobacter nicotinovorans]